MEAYIPGARVLVTVKAYPQPSRSYEELVCTAGLLDGERWVRIYPVPFRFLAESSKYPKYGWIRLNLERRDTDFRPESYRPAKGIHEQITVEGKVADWEERRRLVCRHVYTSMQSLIDDAYGPNSISLACLKPTEIRDVRVESAPREWDTAAREAAEQLQLFERSAKRIVRKVPYRFAYSFATQDGRQRTLHIEDWEIGALYWNCLARHHSEKQATDLVRAKCWDLARNRDLYFLVGTSHQWHVKHSDNPFMIVGLFYPPRNLQPSLF